MTRTDHPLNDLNKTELRRIINIMRIARDDLMERKVQLQMREEGCGDGAVREAIIALENETALIADVIAKLWVLERRMP